MKFFVVFVLLLSSLSRTFSEGLQVDSIVAMEKNFPRNPKSPRIKELWPSDYIMRLAIEPAIPQNFVMKGFSEGPLWGYFFWGEKETLDAWDCKDHTLLQGPVFAFRFSECVAQTQLQEYYEKDTLEKQIAKDGGDGLKKRLLNWGGYPILAAQWKIKERPVFGAWIGSNYESNVLFAHPIFPHKEGRPNADDIALWDNFLSNTRVLSEQDALLSAGWDLELGYTWFDTLGVGLLCVAERRNSDKKEQIVVFRNAYTEFAPEKIEHARVLWGSELLKVHATLSANPPNDTHISLPGIVINVRIKNVEKFSLDKEALLKDPRIFVHQQ